MLPDSPKLFELPPSEKREIAAYTLYLVAQYKLPYNTGLALVKNVSDHGPFINFDHGP